MDLQAILDSTDDSSSSENDGGGSSSLSPHSSGRKQHHIIAHVNTPSAHSSSKHNISHHRYYGTGLGTPGEHVNPFSNGFGGSSVDLEQILREDDGDDDDEDEEEDDDMMYSGRKRSHKNRQSSSALMPSNTPEEWDVLQAILGEDSDEEDHDVSGYDVKINMDDDTDEDDDRVMVMQHSRYTSRKDYQGARGISSSSLSLNTPHSKVDLILQQSEDEDDEEIDETILSSSKSQTFNFSSWNNASNEYAHNLTDAPVESFVTAAQSEESEGSDRDVVTSATDEAISPPKKEKFDSRLTASTSDVPMSNRVPSRLYRHDKHQVPERNRKEKRQGSPIIAATDADLDKASQKALQVAKAQERKLLKSGRRDIVSPLMVKRRLKPKIELGTRSQTKQRENAASQSQNCDDVLRSNGTVNSRSRDATTSHSFKVPRFGFAGGIIDTKNMATISKRLSERCRSHQDLPTAMGINSRFMAVGTQKGVIFVFDLFEVLRQKLGGSSSPEGHDGNSQFNHMTAGSVTTIDLSLVQGEFLAAGYTSGNIVLWDTIKGVALKNVVETSSPSPIVSVRFLSDLKLVTVDAGGLVNKLNFTKNMLWITYSVESECLLDGTAGQILAINVLPPYHYVKQQLPQNSSTLMKRLVLLALSSERSSFAVAVEPKVNVLHRWAKPEHLRVLGPKSFMSPAANSRVFLPCLSWGWALVNGGGHVIAPILARAWGCCIQLLRAIFPEFDDDSHRQLEVIQWPAFGVHDEFDVDTPVVALEWLNERSLVYLSMKNEFIVADTVMMTLLERLDFSGLKLVYAEFSLSRTAKVDSETAEGSETYYCTTFQNSFRACDNRLLLLCQEELKTVSIVGARPRISGLENDGEWLEALALALDHYENTIKSQEDRRRDPIGTRDLSKHPGFRNENGRTEDEEWIAKLLIRYLNVAVENAPETKALDHAPEIANSQAELAKSHFQMLAGVCVEFCLVTKRLDLLFGPIFRRFHSAGFLTVFLDVLEPYILNDKLDYIAPEAMMHFVEHCRASNGIATVERCLLHMDVTIMDFDSILTLLRANDMYSALFYVYNQGLNDYTTPLEILCEKIFDSADTIGELVNERRIDGIPQNEFEKYGYKAILYLQSCFNGKSFPKGVEMQDDVLISVKTQLLKFLLQTVYSPSRSVKKSSQAIGQRALRYPYAHILLMVDPKAMFETLAIAMNVPNSSFRNSNAIECFSEWEVEAVGGSRSSSSDAEVPDRQAVISMLLSIIMPSEIDVAITHQTTFYQSQSAVNAFLDFLAEYLMKGAITADKKVTFMIFQRMASRFSVATEPQDRQYWQGQIISLVGALPRSAYDTDCVLDLLEKSGAHRAALLLHQEEASSWPSDGTSMELRASHFRAAIDCYLDDENPDFQKEVYDYVKKECSGVSDDEEPNALREALVSKLIDLVLLDPLLTAELTADLFVDDPDQVVRSLNDEEARFLFFRAIISGDLNELDPVAGSVLNAQLTMDHHHQYMALMAKLHPDSVYDYLSSHDNYRLEECLQLCQKYDIADASAYLLERMGNVTSALQLILQTVESRMMNLKRTIRGLGTDYFEKYYHRRVSKVNRATTRADLDAKLCNKQEKEIEGLKRILTVALDVCERNSGSFSTRTETENGSQLWFNVLDRLINAKGFLRLSKEQPAHAQVMAGVLSELLRLTMQRMVSSVPLPDLVRKVTSDHSGSRLGELREMIESLLITYGLELDVFGGAVNVFNFDNREMAKAHHALRIKGSNVKSIMDLPLDGSSSFEVIQAIRNEHEFLQLGGDSSGNAKVVFIPSSYSAGNKHEQGLGDALSRLRTRRSMTSNLNAPDFTSKRVRSLGLNFMATEERIYIEGETSLDVTYFEERQVGQLGNAEHRGRIMSFMY
jgi:hypothetical protein